LCRRKGTAALYVSHDLAVVAQISDCLAVMYAGQVVEQGPTNDVLANPAHPYTRALLQAIPDANRRSRLKGIEGRPPDPGTRPIGCHFAPRCPLVLPECHKPISLTSLRSAWQARCIRSTELMRSVPGLRNSAPASSTNTSAGS